MKDPIFTGSAVALITPFTETGVDYSRLEGLIEFHIKNNTDALVVCATTGEAPTLPDEEHEEILRFVVDKTAKRIPVIAGTGSNYTAVSYTHLCTADTSRFLLQMCQFLRQCQYS